MGNYIPEDIIQEILERISIQEVVSKYVTLKPQGKNLVGLCPFHSEKTPSFSVNPSKGLFYCFGCGFGGNVINFIMKTENFSFPEAIEFLAAQAGILITDNKLNKKSQSEKNKLIKINQLANKLFQYLLWKSPEGVKALSYLEKRGITKEAILNFELGFAVNRWDTLYKYMLNKGISSSYLLKLGLINQRQDNTGYYDRFRGRIIFPIYNHLGIIAGFGGRLLDDNDTGPKYLNSPETELFQKGHLLYGLNIASDEIRKKDYVILVEGYMDVISAHQSGVTNTIASLGTAFSAEQAKVIKRHTDNVIICYDSDDAGQNAALRNVAVLADNGCKVKVLTLPNNYDPDDFIKKHGSEAFINYINQNAETYIEYKINTAFKNNDLNTSEGKRKVIESVIEDLVKIVSLVEKEYYIRLLAQKLGVSEQAIANEITKAQKIGINRDKKVKERNNSKESYFSTNNIQLLAEKKLIKYILENPNQISWFLNNLGVNILSYKKSKELIKSMLAYLKSINEKELVVSNFFLKLPQELQSYVSEILTLQDDRLTLNDCVLVLKDNWYKQQIANIRREIATAEQYQQTDVVNVLVLNLMELQEEWKKLKMLQHYDPNGRGGNDERREQKS